MNHTSKLPLTLLPKVPGLRLEDTFIDADTVSLTLATAQEQGMLGSLFL